MTCALEDLERRLAGERARLREALGGGGGAASLLALDAAVERRRLRLRRWLAALEAGGPQVVPPAQIEGLWEDLRTAWSALHGRVELLAPSAPG